MSQDHTSVALILSGFACDPEQLTKALNMQPSETLRIGDRTGRKPKPIDTNIWRLNAPPGGESITESIALLLAALPHDFLARTQGIDGSLETQIAVAGRTESTQTPVLSLDAMTLQRIAGIRASLDVTFLFVGD